MSGHGTGASVGQAHAPGMPWPALQVRALSRSLNFETAAFREELVRGHRRRAGGVAGARARPVEEHAAGRRRGRCASERTRGRAALDLQITHAAANEAVEITVPDNVRAATETGTDRVTVDKVVDGVWFLAGGTHHSVAIEQAGQSLLMVWLPRERLLIHADAFTPGPPGSPVPATPDPNPLNLVQNFERLGIAPRLIVPLHGRVVPASDLHVQTGRGAPP